MVITCDTDLSEILDSNQVIEICGTVNSQANGLISSRAGVLTTGMQPGGGIDSSQIIDDQPVFTTAGQKILEKYARTSETISRVMQSAGQAAVDKEIEELETLGKKINEKVSELNDAIDNLSSELALAMESNNPDVDIADLYDTLRALRESRQHYIDKYDLVKARLNKLDPTISLPTLSIDAGAATGGDENDSGSTTEATEADSGKTNDQYKIPTEGRSTAEMYEDARNLEDALIAEEEYLTESKNGLEYSLAELEQQHAEGNISDSDYERLKGEYEARIANVEAAIQERATVLEGSEHGTGLQAATQDNFGTKDGWLKDSKEGGMYGTLGDAGNEANTAARVESEINAAASQVTPIDQVIAENGLAGVAPLRADGLEGNPYNQGMVDSQSTYMEPSSISNTTREAAYLSATSQGTTTEVAPGVYAYSVQEYFATPAEGTYPTMLGFYTSNEYQTANSYVNEGQAESSGDTVFDSNTGKFYTMAEWSAANTEK